jgi:hypothetical protein
VTRWHLLRRGRIVRTAWSSDGDCAERELNPYPTELIVSDEEWRAVHYRRALLAKGVQCSTR